VKFAGIHRKLDTLVLNLGEGLPQFRILNRNGKELGGSLVAHAVLALARAGAAGLS
jgi:hypothetical protein